MRSTSRHYSHIQLIPAGILIINHSFQLIRLIVVIFISLHAPIFFLYGR